MRKEAGLGLLKLSAAAADHLRPQPRGVVVLIYHRVGAASRGQVDLPTPLFAAQMAALAATGRAVSIDGAVDVLSGAEAAPAVDPVVVTFDDGTADFAETAVPILVEHGIPATMYLATDFVERGQSFPDDGAPLSWAAMRDCLETGLVTVGSHTHTHALLDRLDPAATAEELDRSIDLIGDRLGRRAAHFAYPKAVVGSPSAEAAVRQRFRSAAIGGTRPNAYGGDLHRLTRSAIQRADGMRWFTRKLEGGMALEDVARRAINRRRYATATS